MSDFDPSAYRLELRRVVQLAAPVVGVQLGMMLMGTVDVMMLGRLDETALAAGALGNAVSFALLMFPIGMLMGLDPLIAQAWGARDHTRVRNHFQRGSVMAIVLAILVSALMWNSEPVLRWLRQDESIISPASRYIRALIPGNLAFLLFGVLRQGLQAMSVVRPALLTIAFANLVNVAANWALIFGNLGLPRLEVVGSAMATSMSRWVMFLGLLLTAFPILRPYLRAPRGALLRWQRYRQLIAVGAPVGLQVSLEMWVFATVAVLMGSLGAVELAGHQIAISLASLSFMVPLGIAGAAATRVGNAIGRGDQIGAKRSASMCLLLGGGVMCISAAAFAVFPYELARLYTSESSVLSVAVVLLPIAAVFQIADGAQVVAAGALRGTADTRWPATIAFVGYWMLGLPTGLLLAYRLKLGPQGLWWGLTLGLLIVAVLFVVRLRRKFSGEISSLENVSEDASLW